MKKALCITAHPDDDTLFAGTLLKLKKSGWTLYEVIFTGGEHGISLDNKISYLKSHREDEANNFAQLVGIKQTFWMKETDGFLIKSSSALKNLVKILRKIGPQVVILLNPNDYHRDHRESFTMGIESIELSTRNAYLNFGKAIEKPVILISDGLNLLADPDLIIDTSKEHAQKMEILKKAYASQLDHNLIRFLEGIALARGARIKKMYGEAFNLAKIFSRNVLSIENLKNLNSIL